MKRRGIQFLLIQLCMAIALIAFTASPARAESDGQTFATRVAGTYLVFAIEKDITTPLLVTLTADGNVNNIFAIQGNKFFNGLSFTDEPGVWKRTGDREITARAISFDYLPPSVANPSGKVVATADYTYVITFDADFNQVSSTYTGVGYPPEVNPLNPQDAKPVFTSSGSFQGQRVTVKVPEDSPH